MHSLSFCRCCGKPVSPRCSSCHVEQKGEKKGNLLSFFFFFAVTVATRISKLAHLLSCNWFQVFDKMQPQILLTLWSYSLLSAYFHCKKLCHNKQKYPRKCVKKLRRCRKYLCRTLRERLHTLEEQLYFSPLTVKTPLGPQQSYAAIL